MSWQLLGVPTYPFGFVDPPEHLTVENDTTHETVRYVPERTCTALWRDNFEESEAGQGEIWFECSECGEELPYGYAMAVIANYCSECGAKVVEQGWWNE